MTENEIKTENEIGWTAQIGTALPEDEAVPGQRFAPEQLPVPENATEAGLAPVVIPEDLIAGPDDPQGPEPWEIAYMGVSQGNVDETSPETETAAKSRAKKKADEPAADETAKA